MRRSVIKPAGWWDRFASPGSKSNGYSALRSVLPVVAAAVLAVITVTPSLADEPSGWVLLGVEPTKNVFDTEGDCYNSQEVTIGDLTATTYAKCTWPSPAVDVWNRSQHSWSPAPPPRLEADQVWQITSTVSAEGTYLSNAISGRASSWVRIDFDPGGGPYTGGEWASAEEAAGPASAVSSYTIPSGSDGARMFVSLSFQGSGGSGAITYTYAWLAAGSSPPTPTPTPTPTPEPPATPTPEQLSRWARLDAACVEDPGSDSGARFSRLGGEVEVYPESAPDEISWAHPSTVLHVLDHVLTGERGLALITFADQTTLMIGPESEIVICNPKLVSVRYEPAAGTFWERVKKAILGNAIEQKTNLAALGINGTTFVTEVTSDATTLKVIEGSVEFTSTITGQQALVTTGETATASIDGLSATSRFDVAAESAKWNVGDSGSVATPDNGGSDLLALAGVFLLVGLVFGAAFIVVSLVLKMREDSD